MQEYILQLLEDMLSAERPQREPFEGKENNKIDNLEKHFEDVERYLSGDYEQKISTIIGFTNEQFPPIDKLTDNQILSIVEGFDKLLYSYNISTDLPDGLAIETAYSLLVSTLEKEVFIGEGDGFFMIEFCQYDIAKCPFGDLCSCKEFEKYHNERSEDKKSDEETLF